MSLSLSRPDLMRRQNLINGEWADARDARRYPVQNPASDALLAEVPDSTAIDARAATDAARESRSHDRRSLLCSVIIIITRGGLGSRAASSPPTQS